MKYLFLLGLAVLVYWWLTRSRRTHDSDSVAPPPAEPEAMVRCAHCGVHLPRHEAIGENSDYFCSAAHRQLGKTPPT